MAKVTIIPTALAHKHFADKIRETFGWPTSYTEAYRKRLALLGEVAVLEMRQLQLLKRLGYQEAMENPEYLSLRDRSFALGEEAKQLTETMRKSVTVFMENTKHLSNTFGLK